MAEKILNTRVQLKYDSLTNWQGSVFNGSDASKYLKKGEVAIVTLGPNKEISPVNTANQHPLLFKVGTGAHKFDDLPFASALAADVYAWAKQDEGTFVDNFLSLKTSNNKTMKDVLDGVFATDAELATAISGVQTSINGIIDRVAALEGKVDVEKVSTAISTAVAGETSRATGVESGLANRITALEGASATHATTAALNAEIDRATAAEAKALADAKKYTDDEIAEVNTTITNANYASKTEAQTYANTAQNLAEQKAAELVNAHTEAVNTKFESYSTTTEMNAAIDADVLVETNRATAAEEALAGRISTLEVIHEKTYATKEELEAEADRAAKAEQANADEIARVNAVLVAAIENEDETALNSIKELATWIEHHGTEAEAITKAIGDEENARKAADEQLGKDIAAEAKARADADAVINGTIATLETKADATEKLNAAKKYTDDSIAVLDLGTMSKETATDYVKKSEATGYDDILTTAAAASTYKTEAQVNSQIDAKLAAKNFGDIITHNVAEFATAEQGAKADTAIQYVETYTNMDYMPQYGSDDYGQAIAFGIKVDGEEKPLAQIVTRTYDGIVFGTEHGSDLISGEDDNAYMDIQLAPWAKTKLEESVQDIEVGVGLKVTDEKVADEALINGITKKVSTIEIDDSVTFIFDCGSATKNI